MGRKTFHPLALIVLLMLLCNSVMAQIPVGAFRTHLSYYGVHSVAATPNTVYAATDNALVHYDRATGNIGTWSKVEGLTETGIDGIYYDKASDYLIVVYNNANIDLIREGTLVNLPDIKNKTMSGDKRINNILSHNGLLYLSCTFGIVVIDPATRLIRDTWYTQLGTTPLVVNSLQIFNNQYFICTNAGIFHTPVQSNAVADFSTWQRVSDISDGHYTLSCIFDNRLYAVRHINDDIDSLLVYDGTHWSVSRIDLSPIRALDATNDLLLVASWAFVQTYNPNEELQNFYNYEAPYLWQNVQDACLDGNTIWVADDNNGLAQIALDWSVNHLHVLDGPYAESSFKMDYSNGVLALVPGGITSTWGKAYTPANFAYFSNEQWINILQSYCPALNGLYDLSCAAINPRNSKEIYAGIFCGGLAKYSEWKLDTVYNSSNSPLQAFDTSEAYIGGLRYDAYGNLWMSCCYTSRPLAVLKTDGTWKTFTLSSYVSGFTTSFGNILIDSRGWKWIIMPRANNIVVFNDNHTIDNVSDDQTTSVNINAAANIETSTINCMVEDKKGEIWIGCNLGIKVIYTPGQIFNGGVYPQNVLVKQGNYVQNLFEFEEVTCMAVDDANRKWVGTAKSGVFLISDNGDKELLHFTTDNSPLLSNRINDICIQRQTGEVFFATNEGLISYRGTATEGAEEYSDVKVFPNPVRETYHGIITVSGLKENSFCKVADAAGNLVWQGFANGGTLTWDGKDFYGNRPATGVYFVFSSDEDGKKKNVAKILFIH